MTVHRRTVFQRAIQCAGWVNRLKVNMKQVDIDFDDPEQVKCFIKNMTTVRNAIIQKIGVFRRGKSPTSIGKIPCPFCEGEVNYSRASYNGHITAQCTKGCIGWIE